MLCFALKLLSWSQREKARKKNLLRISNSTSSSSSTSLFYHFKILCSINPPHLNSVEKRERKSSNFLVINRHRSYTSKVSRITQRKRRKMIFFAQFASGKLNEKDFSKWVSKQPHLTHEIISNKILRDWVVELPFPPDKTIAMV